ncbi:MAG: serine/threonine-protein kinase [Polyangiaceae bacterium]
MDPAPDVRGACFGEDTVLEIAAGGLDAEHHALAQEHLAVCDDCRRLVAVVVASTSDAEGIDLDSVCAIPQKEALARSSAVQVGRYTLLARIGAGGSGVIFRARDPQLRRDVALKLVRAETTGNDPAAARRLLREAQAMARLAHPNVVTVYDAGMHEGQVFLAMELVDGQTLRQWSKTRRSHREVLDMFVAAGRGLEAAHGAGLVHRDFKPSNVLVGHDGRPRVTDFGLARTVALDPSCALTAVSDFPLEGGVETVTLAGMLVGTPQYMAPEQFLGLTTDARTDQFGFSVALYEAIHGRRPFAGRTLQELAFEVTHGNVLVPPLGSVPPNVARAIARGLHVSPEERFPSMSELLAALGEEPAETKRPAKRRGSALVLAAAATVAVIAAWRAAPTPEAPALARSSGAFHARASEPAPPGAAPREAPGDARAETPPASSAPAAPAATQGPAVSGPRPGSAAERPRDPELILDPWAPR